MSIGKSIDIDSIQYQYSIHFWASIDIDIQYFWADIDIGYSLLFKANIGIDIQFAAMDVFYCLI